MKNIDKFFKAVNTLLYSWGSDTPPEVLWGMNEMLEWLEEEHDVLFNIRYECFEDGVGVENSEKVETVVREKLGAK